MQNSDAALFRDQVHLDRKTSNARWVKIHTSIHVYNHENLFGSQALEMVDVF